MMCTKVKAVNITPANVLPQRQSSSITEPSSSSIRSSSSTRACVWRKLLGSEQKFCACMFVCEYGCRPYVRVSLYSLLENYWEKFKENLVSAFALVDAVLALVQAHWGRPQVGMFRERLFFDVFGHRLLRDLCRDAFSSRCSCRLLRRMWCFVVRARRTPSWFRNLGWALISTKFITTLKLSAPLNLYHHEMLQASITPSSTIIDF